MKSTLFVLLIFFISSCSKKSFVGISKKIEKECTNVKGTWKGTTFHGLRTKLYNEGKLNFINAGLDTLYILESYEIQSGIYSGRIWNRKGVLNYTYNRGVFTFEEEKLFTDYTVQLIRNWDITAIRLEESANAHSTPQINIYAARVFKVNERSRIECMSFKAFFKLERDR